MLVENFSTVVLSDTKGRITIPTKVREAIKGTDLSKLVFKLSYDPVENKIILIPIGEMEIQ